MKSTSPESSAQSIPSAAHPAPAPNPKHISLKAPMLALKASAGSGKTSALATRYIILLFQGAKPSEILAITFAKKATKEMQERIAYALLEITQGKKDSQFYQNLVREGFSQEQIARLAPRIYQDFLHSKLRILTIDAFFNAILKKFSHFVGLHADFTMLGDSSEEEYANEAMKERFLESIITKSNSSHTKSPNQNPSGLESLFAMREDLDIELDGLLDFVWQCFKDKTHFSKEFFEHYRTLDIPTLQQACNAYAAQAMEILLQMRVLLEESGERIKKPLSDSGIKALEFESFGTLLESKSTWLALDDLQEYKYFGKILKADDGICQAVQDKYAQLRECICAYSQNLEQIAFAHIASVLHSYTSAYHSWLASTQAPRFIDCTLLVYMLLADSSQAAVSAEFFYFRMDSVITHILIDEFQDTNAMQYRIMKPLIDEIRAGLGAKHPTLRHYTPSLATHSAQNECDNGRSFFIVGDSKQSIYGFRGSESGLFDKVIAELDLQVENLPYNYRSYREVVEFVNAVFAKIFPDYVPQALPEPVRQNLAQTPKSSTNTADDKSGGFVRVCKVQAHKSGSKSANADEKRKALIASALHSLEELLHASVSANDIAFLCSTNAECANLRSAIKQRFPEINIVLNARAKLTDEPSVKILLTALKLLRALESSKSTPDSAKSSGAKARFYFIELAKLLGTRAFAREEVLESTPLDVSTSNDAMDFTELSSSLPSSFAAIKHTIMQATAEVDSSRPSSYLLYFIQRFTLGDKSAQLLLEQSIEHEDIDSLLDALESSTPDAPKDNQNGLQILTIHKSKGLEYPYVIIVDSAPKTPSPSKILFDEHGALLQLKRVNERRQSYDLRYQKALETDRKRKMLEAHNVLYVACTRAQKGLILLAHDDEKSSRLAPVLEQLPLQEIARWEITQDFGVSESSTRESSDNNDDINTKECTPSTLRAECIIMLESGAIIGSQKQSPPKAPTPTILTQESHGRQECFIKSSEQEEYASNNIAHIRFGQALHLGLEYALGYGTPREQIAGILHYRFGLDSHAIDKVLTRIAALESNAKLQSIFQSTSKDKSGAKNAVRFVEAPLVVDGKSYRLDLLVYDRDLGEVIVIDYKSGAKKPSHQKQVQNYLALLQQADSAQLHQNKLDFQGYVLYLGEHIEWLAISPEPQIKSAQGAR